VTKLCIIGTKLCITETSSLEVTRWAHEEVWVLIYDCRNKTFLKYDSSIGGEDGAGSILIPLWTLWTARTK
jgi:hypothetical protein